MTDRERDAALVAEFRERAATDAPTVEVFRCTAEAVVRELDRLAWSREFCQGWYAERWERLRKLIRDKAPAIDDEACCVMANGTADADEVPTYAQLLSRKDMEIGRLTQEVGKLQGMVDGLAARVAAQSELLGQRAERREM